MFRKLSLPSLPLLLLFSLLPACFDKKAESKEQSTNTGLAESLPSPPSSPEAVPLDPRLLEAPPMAQDNLGGPAAVDSIGEEEPLLEPLPPASEGSPYKASEPVTEKPKVKR